MIKIKWKNEWIEFEKAEWSGTSEQCSRQLSFSIPHNSYDKEFPNKQIKLGDLIYLYNDKNCLFVGTVTSRERTAEIGTREYVAQDFMHHLLRSSGTFKFKNMSPETITKKLCKNLDITVGPLAKTRVNIPKIIFEEQSYYDMIVRVYRKAKATTKKIYMPVMDGKKVSVIVKGTSSGVVLEQGKDITEASYSDTTDNIVDKVVIYNDKLKKLGEIKDDKNISKYGIYQSAYTKEKGVNAKNVAKSMLIGATKEAQVTALGNIKAISGKSIKIKDSATGLTGTFYISADTHTFEDDTHIMNLELAWENVSEEGADVYEPSKSEKAKKKLSNASKCYYLENSNVYHSSKSCTACAGKKNLKTSTVVKMKKIKIARGKNKGKRKYKACSKCWR
ncbi:MAG: hypothetical protein HFJ09_05425 [Lachnospiraceae bacterium]|nr:hypothetical protein [Lachnospiraceae bacterium]